MTEKELMLHLAKENISVVDAMRLIDSNANKILFIVDEYRRLIGSLTDGDIRRWLIKTGELHAQVGRLVFRPAKYLYENQVGMAQEFMGRHGILAVPVLAKDREVVDIILKSGIKPTSACGYDEALADVPVIIMAGGKGTRLYPYTKILPKPLIPIGDVPILERIMDRLSGYGAKEFYLTVNYKKGMIKSYFSEREYPFDIHYVEEDMPLGTAGSIRLIRKQFHTPIIITNCDILIEADYADILRHHVSSHYAMTVVSSLKNFKIPYGVMHAKEGGIIDSISEKPDLSYFINTGMYIVNPECLAMIPGEGVFHMTDLMALLLENGDKIGMYPISENSFLDMGEFEEMKKMEDRIT